jgi:1,3-beta-galactosyl-N-acetylhexosamine phosphorylase
MSEKNTGRVTIPTNLDVVPETIELMKRWGADAIRDCDGTEFPEELTKTGAKIYATYYTKSNIISKHILFITNFQSIY